MVSSVYSDAGIPPDLPPLTSEELFNIGGPSWCSRRHPANQLEADGPDEADLCQILPPENRVPRPSYIRPSFWVICRSCVVLYSALGTGNV